MSTTWLPAVLGFCSLEREKELERGEGGVEGERGRAGENEGQARPGDTGSTRESTHSQEQLPDTPTLSVRQGQGGKAWASPPPTLSGGSGAAQPAPVSCSRESVAESELRALLLRSAAAVFRIQARLAALCS